MRLRRLLSCFFAALSLVAVGAPAPAAAPDSSVSVTYLNANAIYKPPCYPGCDIQQDEREIVRVGDAYSVVELSAQAGSSSVQVAAGGKPGRVGGQVDNVGSSSGSFIAFNALNYQPTIAESFDFSPTFKADVTTSDPEQHYLNYGVAVIRGRTTGVTFDSATNPDHIVVGTTLGDFDLLSEDDDFLSRIGDDLIYFYRACPEPGCESGSYMQSVSASTFFDAGQDYSVLQLLEGDDITQGTFAIGSIPGAAPEPAAWAGLLVGFGTAGSALRRRRRAGRVAVAAVAYG